MGTKPGSDFPPPSSGIDKNGDQVAPGGSLLARGRELPSAVAARKAQRVLENPPGNPPRGVPRVVADGGTDPDGRLPGDQDLVIDGVTVRYPDPAQLTGAEQRAWDALAQVATMIMLLPALHPADVKETARDIHCLQNRLLARAAYPARFRET